MASLFNQTTVNQTPRYFFATRTEGEQDLYTQTGLVAGLSTFNVGITGAGGNLVQIDTMPQVTGTEFVTGEQAVFAGTASQYLTLSTINTGALGVSISHDRVPGSGLACIESYSGNGSFRGFEFLSRGLNSELISTVYNGINVAISTVGSVGATAKMSANGSFITGDTTCGAFSATEYPSGQGGFGAGRPCYGIRDISGADNATSYARWTIGTTGLPTGGNAGSDYTLFAYNDAGNFTTSPMKVRRSDGAFQIANISSIQNSAPAGTAQVFPASKANTEFGEGTGVPIAGASNQATPYVVLFSTPVSGLNPNTQTLLNINFINSLSTASNLVNYKVGFSTATAYTNILQSSYVPGIGGSWTPAGIPGATSPTGATNICAMLDSDGLNPDGTGFLYVAGQFANPNEPADLIYVKKGYVSEATRNALVYRPV